MEEAVGHAEVGGIHQSCRNAQDREDARGACGNSESYCREPYDRTSSRLRLCAVAPREQKADGKQNGSGPAENKTAKRNPDRVHGIVERPGGTETRCRHGDVPDIPEENAEDPPSDRTT